VSTISEALRVALQQHQAGNTSEAEQIYRQILQADPQHADAWHLLGVIAHQVGKQEVAADHIGRAIRINPNVAEFHINLGAVHLAQSELDQAGACFARALELRPDYAEAHNNLGAVFQQQRQLDEAAACYRRALELRPNYAEAHFNLGNALHEQKRSGEAVACFRRALEIRPDHAPTHNNLGLAFQSLQNVEEALTCFRRALEIRPDYAEAFNNLGLALHEEGKFQDATDCYRRALEFKPAYSEVHYNQSLLQLLLGDFEHGWSEYEWRWQTKQIHARHNFPQPIWDGQPLPGRTILLHAEQGYGDTLQFIRYATLVKQRGGTVVIECQPELLALLKSAHGIDRLVSRGESLPEFDVHAPLLSLPAILQTRLDSIPCDVPYLVADPARSRVWRDELLRQDALRVGIAWQGNPKNVRDRARSIPLSDFEQIAGVSGVQLYSLQVGPGREQIESWSGPGIVIDLADRLTDFAETAAAMSNLDLVITCDSACAHLAGAMGRSVWIALPTAPDWRWLLGRDDSPWYPTARLFRQQRRGDWSEVFRRIGGHLRELVNSRC
jgi:tetratricopeptide (TPR) repeat protein